MTAPVPGSSILLVEDDFKTADTVALYLRHAGHRVALVRDGTEGLARAVEEPFDLVILDRMLPGIEGLDVCSRIRERSDVPIIMLTAVGGERDRLEGFATGADDYVVKPFSPRELVARAHAVLRRADARAARREGVLRVGPLVLDVPGRTATVHGHEIPLSPTEHRLLTVLARAPGRTFSRRELRERALSRDSDADDRVIDSHVKNLRRKLAEAPGGPDGDPGDAPSLLRTVFGAGYKLVDPSRDP